MLRRKPQTITSIVQPFDESLFNFTKASKSEVLLQCQSQLGSTESGITTFLINNSPLTKFHSLICPRLGDKLSQIITKESVEFAIDLLTGLNDRCYRIGYNSLCALASVNHLHLHLMHLPEKIFIEDVVCAKIFHFIINPGLFP